MAGLEPNIPDREYIAQPAIGQEEYSRSGKPGLESRRSNGIFPIGNIKRDRNTAI
jgi:hypothetical protein